MNAIIKKAYCEKIYELFTNQITNKKCQLI